MRVIRCKGCDQFVGHERGRLIPHRRPGPVDPPAPWCNGFPAVAAAPPCPPDRITCPCCLEPARRNKWGKPSRHPGCVAAWIGDRPVFFTREPGPFTRCRVRQASDGAVLSLWTDAFTAHALARDVGGTVENA